MYFEPLPRPLPETERGENHIGQEVEEELCLEAETFNFNGFLLNFYLIRKMIWN